MGLRPSKIKTCYNEVIKNNNDGNKDWIFNNYPQVVLQCFILCGLKHVSYAKRKRNQRITNMAYMYEEQLKNIQQINDLTNSKTTALHQRNMLNGLLSYLVISRDIIGKNADEAISSVFHFYDKNCSSTQLKMM